MSKAVLVMEMPKKCAKCCCFDRLNKECLAERRNLNLGNIFEIKPSWCPLKPLPQKQKLTFHEPGQDAITMGWNACIEEIEGNLK